MAKPEYEIPPKRNRHSNSSHPFQAGLLRGRDRSPHPDSSRNLCRTSMKGHCFTEIQSNGLGNKF